MNARFYSPATGRFLTADTLIPSPTNPQSHNRYSYVLGNAINLTDPTGHFSESAIYGYLYAYECNLSHECAMQHFNTWKSNEEWWAMLLIAEAGDVLFGTFVIGAHAPVFFHFQFDGSGDSILTGISYVTGKGERISGGPLESVRLQNIFEGSASLVSFYADYEFSWGGL